MSENEATIGQILREAREVQGLRTEDVAARLRLMQRQIEAMEADDFESLGRPVFARGFVRNYARLLGLDAGTLLARMEGPRTEPAPVHRPEPPLPRSWLSSPWLILVLLGLLAAVAVPVALYWWLNEGEDEFVKQVPSAMQVDPVRLDVPAPVATPADAPAPVEPAAAPATEPEAESPAVPAPVPTPAPTPAPTSAPEPAAEPAAKLPAEAGAPAAPAVAGSVLHFEFAEDSWVEVRDASGRMLHRQLNPAGSSVNVRGRPPFELVVGNAAQARMTYNGRTIDLKPFIGQTVARFTLEE